MIFMCPPEQLPIVYCSGILFLISLIISLKSLFKYHKSNGEEQIKALNLLIKMTLVTASFGSIFIITGFFSAVPKM